MDDNLWLNQRLPDGTSPSDVNELKPCILSILPYVILEPPVTDVRAYDPNDVQMAAIWGGVAEHIDKRLDLFSEFYECAYDALLYGDGVMKLGYWEDILLDRPLWGEGLTEPFGQSIGLHASHTPLYEIYPDMRKDRWNKMEYIIHSKAIHIDDVKSNPAYKQSIVKKIKPNLQDTMIYDVILQNKDMKDEYVAIQEIHDYRDGKVRVMAPGVDDWLAIENEPYGISPFEHLQFMFRPRTLWGDSISQAVQKHQKDISEITTYMVRALSREGIVKLLMRMAEWDEGSIVKLKSPYDEIIAVNAENLEAAAYVRL